MDTPRGEDRTLSPGQATVLGPVDLDLDLSFEDAFRLAYAALRPLLREPPAPGVLCALSTAGRLQGAVHLPIAQTPSFAVVGRHHQCDLGAPRDPSMSLRHALVRVCSEHGAPRVRVIDLRSPAGLHAEDGTACGSLTASGPLFLRAGTSHLLIVPGGGDWPEDPAAAWSALPPRAVVDLREPDEDASLDGTGTRRVPVPALAPSLSSVASITFGPRELRLRPRPADGARIATIRLSAGERRLDTPVFDGDIERGLLVGRYHRCALGSDDHRLSRVHLWIGQDGGGVWAVDTASTNGTVTGEGRPVRQVQLLGTADLLLARRLHLRWLPAPRGEA